MNGLELDRERFWVLGDVDRLIFLGSKSNGCYYGSTLIDVSSAEFCERFESLAEARRALKDSDIAHWRSQHRYPKAIRPVCIEVSYTVMNPGKDI